MSFRFRMYLADGEELDDYTRTQPDWSPGDVVYAGGWPAYRITARSAASTTTSMRGSGKSRRSERVMGARRPNVFILIG